MAASSLALARLSGQMDCTYQALEKAAAAWRDGKVDPERSERAPDAVAPRVPCTLMLDLPFGWFKRNGRIAPLLASPAANARSGICQRTGKSKGLRASTSPKAFRQSAKPFLNQWRARRQHLAGGVFAPDSGS